VNVLTDGQTAEGAREIDANLQYRDIDYANHFKKANKARSIRPATAKFKKSATRRRQPSAVLLGRKDCAIKEEM